MSYQGAHTGAELDDAVGVAKGSGTGFVVKTATGEGVRRSFATSANLEITNGDGVAGDIGLDLSSAVIASLALADSAAQPTDLAAVATTGAYDDLSGLPTLGTAASTDSTAYATAAQGALADTAVQPADLSIVATSGAYGDLSELPVLGTMAGEAAADYTPTSGFGSAAFTESSAYATAAQGDLADTAVQPGDATAVPYVAVVTDKTFALTDANTEQQIEAAAVLTIPAESAVAFARGDKVSVLSITTGAVSINAVAGVTLNGVSAGSATLTGQYSGAVITKIGADAWVIAGDIGEVS